MPRKARRESSTGMYHVMSRGLNKMPVFNENREKTRIINLIRENLSLYDVEIYAYCIMPNHFHLLIKADLKELASFMAKVLAAYANYYNFKHHRVGYVFQSRFKSECVEDEKYFWNCLRYIHCNPSKSRDPKELLQYKYSSIREFYKMKKDLISQKAFGLVEERFRTKERFLQFHANSSWTLFEDVEEEMMENSIRIAKEYLNEYSWKNNLSELEVLEYVRTRIEYEEELMKILCLSKKKIKEIETIVLDELKRDTV